MPNETRRTCDIRVRARSTRRAGRAWTVLLFLPSLGLLAFALHQRSRNDAEVAPFDAPRAPDRLGETGDIPGWEASVEVRGASRLALRLEALHPDPERQAFDARALARALRPELPQAVDGAEAPMLEPWRLSLSAFPSDGPTGDDMVVVDTLVGVSVQGLEPIVPAGLRPTAAALFDEAVDPRVALFGFPDAPLAVGETHDLVFWGRRPVRGRPVRVRVPGVSDEIDLEPRARAGRRTTQAIAFRDVDAFGVESAVDVPATGASPR
ncbi:MAG: hypothetical protein AAFU73_18015 [Planctomycetota bacterium]